MNVRRIAAIALSNRDFPSFPARLEEACRWVALAARCGARLAVLPEALNLYRGDGPGNPLQLRMRDVALDDWRKDCAPLIECARTNRIAVVVPVIIRESQRLFNVFYLVSADGEPLGRYVKTFPAPGELDEGITPAPENRLIPWDGLRVGGAICYDMNFPEVFARQKEEGADLFLIPSMYAGGAPVNYYARVHQCPMIIAYSAWSRIIDLTGEELAAGGYRHETLRFGFGAPLYLADLNFDKAVFNIPDDPAAIPALLDRYGVAVHVELLQDTGTVVVESCSESVTVKDLAREFGLVTPEDSFRAARTRTERLRPPRSGS